MALATSPHGDPAIRTSLQLICAFENKKTALLASWPAIVFCFATSMQAAHAEQIDLSQLSLEQLLEVNVAAASKYEQRISDAPSAVQVISREDIKRHGWRTLADALNTLPGMYSVNDRAYDYLGARGFQVPGDYNTRFLLLIDGQRNNDNIYQQALVGSEGWLDMSVVERIEYIPGPGSAIYGSNAMFGVINVITRSAGTVPLNQVSALVSQTGQTGMNVMTSRRNDDTGLLLQFSTEHQAGHDQTYSDPLSQLIRADNTVSPDGIAHGLDSGNNRHFMLRVDHGEWGIKIINHERTVTPSSALYRTVFDDPSLKVNDGGTQLTTFIKHELSEDSSVFARVAYTDWHFRGTYPYLDPTVGYNRNYDDTHGQSLEGELSINTRLAAHHVIAGFDFSQDLLARQQNFNSVPSASDININPLINRRGLFMQDEWRMAPTWLLSLGLRMDSATQSETSRSPRLGLIWQPNRDWTAKLLTGRAYRSPNAYESQYANAITNLGNPNLKPEIIQTTEGVLEWMNNGQTRWMLSLFDNKIDQLIHPVDTTGSGLMQFQNGSWARVRGSELGVEQTNSDKMRLRSSIAYNAASNGLDTRQENSPVWIGKFLLSAPVGGDTAFLAGDIQVIGSRSYMWQSTPYSVGSEFLANATLTFPNALTKGLQVQLRVSNLFNRQVQYPSSGDMLTPITPGLGRILTTSVLYEF
jgi:iron complex outermembrane receptor protein